MESDLPAVVMCQECDAQLEGMQVRYCSPACRLRARGKRRNRIASRSLTTCFTQVLSCAKYRARQRGIEYTIVRADIPSTTHCARTGIEFRPEDPLRCPSLDRIANTSGYIAGNVEWVCSGYKLLKCDRPSYLVTKFLEDVSS